MKFPPDYPIESLRGARRLTPARRRRALEERAAWLEDKIRQEDGVVEEMPSDSSTEKRWPGRDLYVKELAAIAQSLEDLEGAEA